MGCLDVEAAIKERLAYPFGDVEFEKEYLAIQTENDPETLVLVFPYYVLFRKDKDHKALRELIFKDRYLKAVVDLSQICAPITALPFALLVLGKESVEKVVFSKYKSSLSVRHGKKEVSSFENLINDKKYKAYLEAVQSWLDTNKLPKNGPAYVFTDIPFDEVDNEDLRFERYDPELIELDKLIKKENFVELGNLADIIRPKPARDGITNGRVFKGSLEYPINYDQIPETGRNLSSYFLQKNDVIVFPFGEPRFYLMYEEPKIPLLASLHSYIIKIKDTRVSPEYLLLYFNSDTIKKYVSFYQYGSTFKTVTLRDLKKFPVIIPEEDVLIKSKALFKQLYLSTDNKLDEINSLLFSDNKIRNEKPIQKEFLLEEIEKLRVFKISILEKIIKNDFKELDKCYDHQLYKSCLVLCGSILEAILLDWLSEIDRKDYFAENENVELFEAIRRLTNSRYLDSDACDKAHFIRKSRNLIHPKAYLRSRSEIDLELCKDVLEALKAVLRKRGIRS